MASLTATRREGGPPGQAPRDTRVLLDAAHALAAAPDLAAVTEVVRHAARLLAGADGATFVQRVGDRVTYLDEDAIGPLWKGRSFPACDCISGWAMLHLQTVVVEDVMRDGRIPQDLYRPTFVRSLVMVPVLVPATGGEPVAAIGAYWARRHRASGREQALLESLAGFASVALRNAVLQGELDASEAARDRLLSLAAHELRTPLTPLQLQADLLLRGLSERRSAEALTGTAERLCASVRRATERVSELLDAERAAHGPAAAAPPPPVDPGAAPLSAPARRPASRRTTGRR